MAATWHRKPGISSMIISMEGKFFKKATGKVFFTCPDGAAIRDAVEKAISTGEPQQVTVYSRGKNAAGETVSEFYFTWSFKVRN
jgi:inosine-uridine nucleoside N-ribohydrolase